MTGGVRVRRRRSGSHSPARSRWGPWILALAILAAIMALYLAFRPHPHAKRPVLANMGQVQSAVAQEGDSLQVIVRWRLAPSRNVAPGESLRVEVRVDSLGATASRARLQPGSRHEDTLYVPAPSPGDATDGLSCVAARDRSMIARETCTAWRYVRPLARLPAPRADRRQDRRARGAAADEDQAIRIVVQPSGLQVDPDIGGRCAEWQRRHPEASVWVEVNRVAVPACMGPNNRPTVAQFCAFAELTDGRRVKTANAANNPYCDRLFRTWERERLS